MKLVKKLDPPLYEISDTLYSIFGLEVAKEDFIIREIGTRRPLRRVFKRNQTRFSLKCVVNILTSNSESV